MVLVVGADPVPLRVDESGTVRVGKTRVLLDLVVLAHEEGVSPEGIVERYPTLQLGDVYGAIAYYLHHREEVRAYLAERERRGEEIRQELESRYDRQAIWARLLARRDEVERQRQEEAQR